MNYASIKHEYINCDVLMKSTLQPGQIETLILEVTIVSKILYHKYIFVKILLHISYANVIFE